MTIVIALPTYNEEMILEGSLRALVAFCSRTLADTWRVVIADNQSTDQTPVIAARLATTLPNVDYVSVAQRGKGAAIYATWQRYDADVYCFMDADLSTDLSAFGDLIAGIARGCDIVVGSRYHAQSRVTRKWSRRIISFLYRMLLKSVLGIRCRDLACGFKAINQRVKKELLVQVQNRHWFFDSELVILAEKLGYRVCEIPVTWQDIREEYDASRVSVVATSLEYIRNVFSLKKRIQSLRR